MDRFLCDITGSVEPFACSCANGTGRWTNQSGAWKGAVLQENVTVLADGGLTQVSGDVLPRLLRDARDLIRLLALAGAQPADPGQPKDLDRRQMRGLQLCGTTSQRPSAGVHL